MWNNFKFKEMHSLYTPHCHLLDNTNATYVSQGIVQKHNLGEMENVHITLLQIKSGMCTKLYHYRLRFLQDMTKTFGVFSVRSSSCMSYTFKTWMLSFKGSVETFSWGTKRLHFCATNLFRTIFTKILPQTGMFCRRYDKNRCVFRFTVSSSYYTGYSFFAPTAS